MFAADRSTWISVAARDYQGIHEYPVELCNAECCCLHPYFLYLKKNNLDEFKIWRQRREFFLPNVNNPVSHFPSVIQVSREFIDF